MTSRRRLFVRSLAFFPAALIALFLGAAAVGANQQATANVKMAGFAFDPVTLTVNVGDTVTWTNSDTQPHNATADDGSFKTVDITQGQSTSITATVPGTHTYICTIHPRMKATLIVQAAGGAPNLPNTGGGGMAPRAAQPWLLLALLGLLACLTLAATILRRRARA
jgi:plastocyanin